VVSLQGCDSYSSKIQELTLIIFSRQANKIYRCLKKIRRIVVCWRHPIRHTISVNTSTGDRLHVVKPSQPPRSTQPSTLCGMVKWVYTHKGERAPLYPTPSHTASHQHITWTVALKKVSKSSKTGWSSDSLFQVVPDASQTLWRPLLPYEYSYKASCARPGWAVICNFWHPSTLTLSHECQSARMSKITNDGSTWSGTGCFIAVLIWQQWAAKG